MYAFHASDLEALEVDRKMLIPSGIEGVKDRLGLEVLCAALKQYVRICRVGLRLIIGKVPSLDHLQRERERERERERNACTQAYVYIIHHSGYL
jgi:hypothetical protein